MQYITLNDGTRIPQLPGIHLGAPVEVGREHVEHGRPWIRRAAGRSA